MAPDRARQRVVLFGGDGGYPWYADTWEWDGNDWTLRRPAVAPEPRWFHAMAYDDSRRRVILHGGFDPVQTGGFAPDWEWDGTFWSVVASSPTPCQWYEAMAYDAARRRVVVFGGTSSNGACGASTLVWGVPAAASAVGTGCAGATGTPRLAALTQPRLGERSFALDVVNARANAPVVFPLSLQGANAPLGGGCRLYVDPSAILLTPWTISNASGFASIALPVPLTHVWAGLVLHAQAAVLDPTAPRGLALTQGLRLTIGD